MNQALQGIRVLDLTHMLSGPYGAMLLADMGAETIKVEPLHGEGTRRWLENDPEFSIEGAGVYFMTLNRNKQSIAVDLKTPQGLQLFHQLVEHADVVISNFEAGVSQRLGIDRASLEPINPRIITCSISGYGSDGPDFQRPSFDLVAQAVSGMMSVTGPDREHPTRAGTPIGDLGAGLFAALGIMAALMERERSGQGQHVDISMLDCQVSLLNYLVSMFGFSGRNPEPMGNAHSVHVPYNSYATKDGHIVIAVLTDGFWQNLKKVLQCEALEQSEYDTVRGRVAARGAIEDAMQALLRTQTSDHWLQRLQQFRVPAGPVNRMSEALKDPQLLHRGMVIDLQHANGETRKGPGNPVKLSRSNTQPYTAAPALGEHTDQVLNTLLGLSAEAIDQLREDGVIK